MSNPQKYSTEIILFDTEIADSYPPVEGKVEMPVVDEHGETVQELQTVSPYLVCFFDHAPHVCRAFYNFDTGDWVKDADQDDKPKAAPIGWMPLPEFLDTPA